MASPYQSTRLISLWAGEEGLRTLAATSVVGKTFSGAFHSMSTFELYNLDARGTTSSKVEYDGDRSRAALARRVTIACERRATHLREWHK